MIKFVGLLLPLCFVHLAQAQSEEMRAVIIDQNIKKTDFPKDVKFDSRKKKRSFSRSDREAQFERLKLSDYTMKMDELDRDLLFMDLRNKSIEELMAAYPKIPAKDLEYAKTHFAR